MHPAGHDARLQAAVRRVEQRKRGVEVRALARKRTQLAYGARMIARLAEEPRGTHRHLIRADDERVAVRAAHRLCFQRGETQCGVGRCFAAQGALVRLWRGDRERQAEPREEFFPVARS